MAYENNDLISDEQMEDVNGGMLSVLNPSPVTVPDCKEIPSDVQPSGIPYSLPQGATKAVKTDAVIY